MVTQHSLHAITILKIYEFKNEVRIDKKYKGFS